MNKIPYKRGLPERERFERHVSTTIGPCPRMFIGGGDTGNGYGIFLSRTVGSPLAHRVAYRLYKGSIDEDLDVLHSCDIRRCVTEEHLRQGTNLDNVKDAIDRDRYSHGGEYHSKMVLKAQDQPNSKLSNQQVIRVITDRIRGLSVEELAGRHLVSRKTIGDILHGRSYRSVTNFTQCTHGAGVIICSNLLKAKTLFSHESP